MSVFLDNSKFEYKSQTQIKVILTKIEAMLKKDNNYQCSQCGYHSKTEFWRCPQCQKWGTVDKTSR